MPQGKSQATDDQDPGQPLREESNQERREEEGGAAPDGAQRGGDGRGDGRPSGQGRGGEGVRGRQPSPEPDVFMDVPKVQVEEIYLDVEGLDAHLSLRTKLGNLLQLVAGVPCPLWQGRARHQGGRCPGHAQGSVGESL